MLFYTILLTLINILAYTLSFSSIVSNFTQKGAGYIINTIVVTGGIILNTIIFVTILLFFKFHLDLVFSNQTTLETLELKRQGKNPDELPSDYDLGNFIFTQVSIITGYRSSEETVACGSCQFSCRTRVQQATESFGPKSQKQRLIDLCIFENNAWNECKSIFR